jgi:hypothetical protein
MSVVMPLVGVVIGGILVLLGDALRRSVEWRRGQAQKLLAAGTDLLAVYSRMVGEMLAAREVGEDLPRSHQGSGDRREAAIRFFALPGSEALRRQVNAVALAHAGLRRALAADSTEWEHLLAGYESALLVFLVDLRTMHRRGRVAQDRPPSLGDVMEISSPEAQPRQPAESV